MSLDNFKMPTLKDKLAEKEKEVVKKSLDELDEVIDEITEDKEEVKKVKKLKVKKNK